MTESHKPQPSYAPALMAAGLTGLLWGVVTSWMVSAVGLVLTGIASALWIGNVGVAPSAAPSKAPHPGHEPPESMDTRASQVAATPWLPRIAVLLAAATLVLLVLGAGVTSKAGQTWETSHLAAGATVALLTLALALLLRSKIGWILLAAVLLQAVLGSRSPGVAAFHAFLAQMFFAATVAVSFMTTDRSRRDPETATDAAKPSLHTLSTVTLALVVAQIALGAAVRHKVMGAGLHITGALVVALAIVVLGIMVTNQYPTHRTLRPTAVAMMVIAGTQVFLGFGAFIVRMMADENTLAVRITTMAHVTTGALTLASTVILALEIRRNLRRPG